MTGQPAAERAAALARDAHQAVAVARHALVLTVDLCDETLAAIGRSEDDVHELASQAEGLLRGEHPRPFYRNAEQAADSLDLQLRTVQSRTEEIGDHVDRAASALAVARTCLRELERTDLGDLHGAQQVGDLRFLTARVTGLAASIEQVRPLVDDAGTRLARARANLEPVLYSQPPLLENHK